MEWMYKQPVQILFGSGKIKELGALAAQLGCRRGLLVCDKYFAENGLAESLVKDSGGSLWGIFSDLSSNPDVEEVDQCAKTLREGGCDFVAALGGGSAMDCAKAASVTAPAGGSVRRFFVGEEPLPGEHLPLIAIPTTAGTGSEVTCVSVLSDHKEGSKSPMVSDSLYPVYALIDPQLTYSVPARVTAGTGIDVLSHALEGYWSKGHQPICDACAVHAIKLVFRYLYRAWQEPRDTEAREKMAEASVIAGLSFTLPKTTAPHACSFPLTNLYQIPHGEACGLTLDYFLRLNAASETDGRLAGLAGELGFASTGEMADYIYEMKAKMGLRTDLKDLNLTKEQVKELVRLSHHPNLFNNPVPVTDDMLFDLYGTMNSRSFVLK